MMGPIDIELIWENVVCNWCGESDNEPVLIGRDLMEDLPGIFRLVCCKNCGLIRQNPRLSWEILYNYYNDDYIVYDDLMIDDYPSLWERFNRGYGWSKRLKMIEKYKKRGKILDVGCGTGIFLSLLNHTDRWEIEGIEPNIKAYEYIQGKLNLPLINERFSNAKLEDDSYDVITMWNVLEHLEYPVDDLKKSFKKLKNGGLLVFSIPNLEGIGIKLFKKYWIGWELPRHLYLFPNHLICEILESVGFQIIEQRCIAGEHEATALSLSLLLKGLNIQKTRANFVLNIYRSLPVKLLLSLPFWLMGNTRRCSLITIIAKKENHEKTKPANFLT